MENGRASSSLCGIFLRCRKSLCSKGTDETGRGSKLPTTARNAREGDTRSTTDAPRLTADRRRTKTLNRGRWRVVALEWRGGDTQGEGTISRLTWRHGVGDARGTPWTLGTDGNTPGGNIYRVSRFEFRCARRNLKNSLLQFLRRWAPYLSENLILIKEGTNVLRMVLTDGGGEEINVCEEIEAIWDKLIRKLYS